MTLLRRTNGQSEPLAADPRPDLYRPSQKIESPVFGRYDEERKQPMSEASRRKIELVFLKLENHLHRMAFLLGEKLRQVKLSDAFLSIKLSKKDRRAVVGGYCNLIVRSKLLAMFRVVRERTRLNLQKAFTRILHEHDPKERNAESAIGRQFEQDRKVELQNQRKTSKLNKRSTLQTDPSKRLYEPTNFKQNENVDNLENRQLRKEMTREEREQTAFVEMMTELLDRFDPQPSPEEPSSTSRPNLTSFCSSPEHFVRGKPTTDKQRFFRKH